MKILIADDHEIVRQGLAQILIEEFPFSFIEQAANGGVLLARVKQEEWDLVITDLSMPVMNGIDALREIRKKFPNLPVLVLSMYSEDYYCINALKAGASGYLTKSMAQEELIPATRKILAGKKYIPASLTFTCKIVSDQFTDI